MISKYLKNFFSKDNIKKTRSIVDIVHYKQTDYHYNNTNPNIYYQNVIVYRCVNLIAQSASHVPWLVMENNGLNKKTIKQHPVYNLLKKPNMEQSGAEFFSNLIANKLLFGNSYILKTSANNSIPSAIYLLPPQNIEIIQNKAGLLTGYKYKSVSGDKIYPLDPINHVSQILHLKNYHPTNNIYGLSVLSAAGLSIDLHQAATKWNFSLLQNGARPSGALIIKDNNNYLTEEQFDRLQSQLQENFIGSNNSGRPLLLEGGLNWQEMSINPKDMEYIETKNSASRDIALAFGIPPQLLGIKGDNTYSNMQEARLALWEETLIPLLDKISDALSNWLSFWYQEDLIIDFDRDNISALTEKRENLWGKIAMANFMTINEKRAVVGLPPINNGDIL